MFTDFVGKFAKKGLQILEKFADLKIVHGF